LRFPYLRSLSHIIYPHGIASNNKHYQIPHHKSFLKVTLSEQDELLLSDFAILDYSFDFCVLEKTSDNRLLLITWMGLPDESQHPTEKMAGYTN